MKIVALALLVALSVVGRAEPYIEPDTAISFPDQCSIWSRTRAGSFPKKEQGVSVAYQAPGRKTITAYVYSNGIPDIKSGANSDEVRAEMNGVASGVEYLWSNEGGTVERIVPISFIGESAEKARGLLVCHKILLGGKTLFSISGLTGYRHRFIKVRYTFQGGSLEEGLRELGSFLTSLETVNGEGLDPFFVEEKPRRTPVAESKEPI